MTTTAADSVDLIALQAAILAHPAVADCAVVARTAPDSRTRLVAYVVCASTFAPERLRAYLDTSAGHRVPVSVVTTSNLPLTADGCLDEAALDGIPALDDDVMARWREAVATIGDVSVTVGEIVRATAAPASLRSRHLGWSPEVAADDPLATASPSIAARVETESIALSISQGDDVASHPDAPATLARALQRAASVSPDKGLISVRADYGGPPYRIPRSLSRADGFSGDSAARPPSRRQGGVPAREAQDFTTAFWGCILGGIVPGAAVGLRQATPPHNAFAQSSRTSDDAEASGRTSARGPSLPMSGRSRATPACATCACTRCGSSSTHLPTQLAPSALRDRAVLLLTSGSTGVPKAVCRAMPHCCIDPPRRGRCRAHAVRT